MPKITRCKHCNKPLALNENAWAAQTGMFCSKECGITDAINLYDDGPDKLLSLADKYVKAESYFNDVSEEISREEYGAYVKVWPAYSSSHDVTTVFNSVYEGEALISTKITGFYFGKENVEDTDYYDGETEAIFVEI